MKEDIIFEKVWQESDEVAPEDRLFDIKVTACDSFIKITNFKFENFYKKIIIDLSQLIKDYLKEPKTIIIKDPRNFNNKYFKEKIEIEIRPPDLRGHCFIDVKVGNFKEQEGNYAVLTVETEMGLLENFGNNILKLIDEEVGYKVSLNSEF